jgi:hypothetical protein
MATRKPLSSSSFQANEQLLKRRLSPQPPPQLTLPGSRPTTCRLPPGGGPLRGLAASRRLPPGGGPPGGLATGGRLPRRLTTSRGLLPCRLTASRGLPRRLTTSSRLLPCRLTTSRGLPRRLTTGGRLPCWLTTSRALLPRGRTTCSGLTTCSRLATSRCPLLRRGTTCSRLAGRLATCCRPLLRGRPTRNLLAGFASGWGHITPPARGHSPTLRTFYFIRRTTTQGVSNKRFMTPLCINQAVFAATRNRKWTQIRDRQPQFARPVHELAALFRTVSSHVAGKNRMQRTLETPF